MIFHRLGLINKNQRGVTLMGIIVAVAITGIIAGAVTTTIFQVFSGNTRTSNHMTAVKQVQNAGYWISHDTQMAKGVEPADESDDDPDGTRFPLTLTWIDWDGTLNEVTYTIVDSELKRSHSINGNTEVSITAQYIDVTIDPDTGKPKTNCYKDGEMLIFTVTATLGTGTQHESETRVYEIVPRPS